MIKIFIIQFLLIVASLFGGCQDEGTGWTPDMIPDENLPSDDDDDDEQVYAPISLNAPLYWSVYEYAWVAEQAAPARKCPRAAELSKPENPFSLLERIAKRDPFQCFSANIAIVSRKGSAREVRSAG